MVGALGGADDRDCLQGLGGVRGMGGKVDGGDEDVGYLVVGVEVGDCGGEGSGGKDFGVGERPTQRWGLG